MISIAGCSLVSAACTTYTVKSGDTCYAISQRRGISLSDFQSWNPGINCNNLQIGQVVCVSQLTSSSSPPSGSCTTYTVKSGDTCYAISQANGISLSNFQRWNSGINCNNLQIGKVVCVSQPTSSSSPPSGSCTTYTVKSGDTCYAISQANGYLFQISRAGTPESTAIIFKFARKSGFRRLQDRRPRQITMEKSSESISVLFSME
ncbi:hypothetical protein KP509_1Z043100 [Ceratopteris richardii]|nr:hypothetical protein KP509_1Z043100 [Ceratopteris richardii]